MGAREALEANVKVIKELDKVMQESASRSGDLQRENHLLISDIIKDEKLLSGVCWQLKLGGRDKTDLFLTGVNDLDLKEIMDLPTGGWHHYSIQLNDKARMSFNDGEVDIFFDDQSYITEFIKEWEIKYTTGKLDDDIKRLQTAADSIRDMIKQIKT